ncbi:hypothetical protein [Salinirubrum litoreum]|uniref:Transporter n=1 Tax=Salinirubrum litoreum TaxID=1126234 RepID=A0ABD5R9L3_9EURY|nr:hypothetical protein [Salinirubrum litoreum]
MNRDLTPASVLFVTGFVAVLFFMAGGLVLVVVGDVGVPALTGLAAALAGLGGVVLFAGLVLAGLLRVRQKG